MNDTHESRKRKMDEIHRRVGGRYEAWLTPSGEVPRDVQSRFPGKQLGITVEALVAQLGGRSGDVTAPDGSRCHVTIDPDAPESAKYVVSYRFIPNDQALFERLVKEAFGLSDPSNSRSTHGPG